MMRLAKTLAIICACCLFFEIATEGGSAQDYATQIEGLLEKLNPHLIKEEKGRFMLGPSLETQEQVLKEMKTIAGSSPIARSEVIASLIRIVGDPAELKPDYGEIGSAIRWTFAVRVLGEIRASEAVDVLVMNLDQTGEFGTISSIHYRPVRSALGRIGEPAIPRLIEVLADRPSKKRSYAASTLARIGQPAVAPLRDTLRIGDANSRGGAALALGWMVGQDLAPDIERAIKVDIERAIKKETNKDASKDMRYAMREIKRSQE